MKLDLCLFIFFTVLLLLPSLGGFDDAEQLCAGLQSSHRLDPASGEAGKNRRTEQVILGLAFSLFFFIACFHSLSNLNCSLR